MEGPPAPRDYRTEQRRLTNKRARDRFYAKPGVKARYRLRNRLAKYNLTVSQFETMRQQQNGCCAICGVKMTPDQKCTGEHIDHNHATGEVRGLLCNQHNTGMGKFNDSADLLRRAADYVEGVSADPDCF